MSRTLINVIAFALLIGGTLCFMPIDASASTECNYGYGPAPCITTPTYPPTTTSTTEAPTTSSTTVPTSTTEAPTTTSTTVPTSTTEAPTTSSTLPEAVVCCATSEAVPQPEVPTGGAKMVFTG